ncbi:LysM peptidoglycan-binding domain-containing protein [Streptomyces monticola]|uniref:LysM peptidoglycan-binding domain-containing protein n=1 Tax=Streptomyces monticola TaxID=2666263 RepID=A0ABW2JBX4_9ACTN
MGIFDIFKHDKQGSHDQAAGGAEQTKEQVQEQATAAETPADRGAPGEPPAKYADPVAATREAADRMAARARVTPEEQHAASAPKPPPEKAAAHEAPAPAPAKERTYTVKSGDSLSAIAGRELGGEDRWRELYDLNRDAIGADPDMIHPGTVLKLP